LASHSRRRLGRVHLAAPRVGRPPSSPLGPLSPLAGGRKTRVATVAASARAATSTLPSPSNLAASKPQLPNCWLNPLERPNRSGRLDGGCDCAAAAAAVRLAAPIPGPSLECSNSRQSSHLRPQCRPLWAANVGRISAERPLAKD